MDVTAHASTFWGRGLPLKITAGSADGRRNGRHLGLNAGTVHRKRGDLSFLIDLILYQGETSK